MNTTSKLIFALVITANLAAIAVVSTMSWQSRTAQKTQVIQLGKIVVTPANAEPETIQLGTIVVTPSDADWRYAKAYGVSRPESATASIAPAGANMQDAATVSLMQAMAALNPGEYLDTDAALRALNTLAFGGPGR